MCSCSGGLGLQEQWPEGASLALRRVLSRRAPCSTLIEAVCSLGKGAFQRKGCSHKHLVGMFFLGLSEGWEVDVGVSG